MVLFKKLILLTAIIALLAGWASASSILEASEKGDLAAVKTLLENDSLLLNTIDNAGYAPLHKAAYNNHLEVVKYLISKGANLNVRSGGGSTPLHGAANSGYLETVRVLVENGADLSIANNNGFTPLLSACVAGKTEVAEYLISHGADPNAKNINGISALRQAVFNASQNMVELLINNGADPDDFGRDSLTSLYMAVSSRNKEISNLLIGKGDRFDIKNRQQLSMLHFAAARGYLDQVKTILAKGVDINARSIDGRTARDYAVLWKHDSVAAYLKQVGADDNKTSENQLKGDYFGQKKPGTLPEIFAENMLLTPFSPHGVIAFAPDGKEVLWCHHAMPIQAMWHMKQVNGVWTQPEIAPFTDPKTEFWDGNPCYSSDGNRLYYHSHRPVNEGANKKEDADIWFVDKGRQGWMTPQNLGSPINTDKDEYSPSVSKNGTIYFIGEGYENSIGKSDIYVSEYMNGIYTAPRNLGPAVNSPENEIGPVIAPDESYLVFASNRRDISGPGLKLFVCFRKDDGSWTEAVSLGRAINRENAWCASLSPDGKYIFYLQNDQYRWVSSQVVEQLRQSMIGSRPPADKKFNDVRLERSVQIFEPALTNTIEVGDLDGDSDIDAVFSNMGFNNSRVLLNDGSGKFAPTDQLLTQQGHGVALGDLDADGDLDALIACAGYGGGGRESKLPSKIYMNDGKARFEDSGQRFGDSLQSGTSAELRDIDTDGDLDAIIGYYFPEADSNASAVYLNDGNGHFGPADNWLAGSLTWGDLDNNGDIDIFVRRDGVGFSALLNGGQGSFSEYWFKADSTIPRGSIALSDLDADGDADAVVASGGNEDCRPTEIWFNDGTGRFTDSGQRLSLTRWCRLGIGDLNGDSHPDLFMRNMGLPDQVWLNDGTGAFFDSGLRLGNSPFAGGSVSLTDLDGDGDLDAFLSSFDNISNEIWINTFNGNK